MIDNYRKFVALNFILYLLYICSPLIWPYSDEVNEIYKWRGHGGSISDDSVINVLMISASLVSFFGLFFLKDWGRRLMLGITVLYCFSIPLWGFYVARPLEVFLSYWSGTCSVVLLVLSYTSLGKEFEKEK